MSEDFTLLECPKFGETCKREGCAAFQKNTEIRFLTEAVEYTLIELPSSYMNSKYHIVSGIIDTKETTTQKLCKQYQTLFSTVEEETVDIPFTAYNLGEYPQLEYSIYPIYVRNHKKDNQTTYTAINLKSANPEFRESYKSGTG